MLTQNEALRLLRYDEETGKCYWRVTFGGQSKAGALAGGYDNYGYQKFDYKGKRYRAHRVIWLMVHGSWPEQIDHIDGNPGNNRLSNLRETNYLGNMRNKKIRVDNISGQQGVCWHEKSSKWQSYICVEKKQIALGMYADKAQAVAKRKMAEILYGFHPNHGRAK